jgi:hypothetical protein
MIDVQPIETWITSDGQTELQIHHLNEITYHAARRTGTKRALLGYPRDLAQYIRQFAGDRPAPCILVHRTARTWKYYEPTDLWAISCLGTTEVLRAELESCNCRPAPADYEPTPLIAEKPEREDPPDLGPLFANLRPELAEVFTGIFSAAYQRDRLLKGGR